jgi:hypothetical protein
MTTFASLGLSVTKASISETVTIMGVSSTKHFTELTITLPTKPRVQATFTREGLMSTLKKLFSKELQMGEKAFDDVVYIATDTPTETASFLSSARVRDTIRRAVSEGGSVAVVGNVVTVKMQGIGDDEPDVIDIVKTIIG